MPDPAPSPDSLLADYLARRAAGSTLEFEALCRAHPEQAAALRELLRQSEEAQVALKCALRAAEAGPPPGGQAGATPAGQAGASAAPAAAPSFAARLKQKYGEGVDPGVTLDEPSSETAESATSELVKRLKEHSLEQSRYALQGEIARGGMGAILRVWDEDLRRHLAMKVILGKADSQAEGATPAVDPRTLGRFLEEAQVTGQLDHPGIVPVHELGLDSDGRVYFTMKLVKGRDLKAIFDLVFEAKESWNETRALGVVLKACEAMAYAHKKGVIHRDLKPANVMVGNFGEVYVMDWGLARVLGRKDTHDIRIAPEFTTGLASVKTERRDEREELSDSPIVTMDGDVMGTPSYMAPEQARGEIEQLGPRSDVYSMGALLYHLFARHAPYVAPGMRVSNRTVLAMVLQGPPAPLASLRQDLPAELIAICEKAMTREAPQRYSDTLALADDLRAYLEHRVVGAYEAGTWAETRKWLQRNRPLAASLAAAIMLLIAGLTASLVFKARADERAAELLAANATIQSKEAKAQAEKANVLKLSAFQTLADLTNEAEELWPAEPQLVERYREWMKKAEELVAKLPEFRSSLAEIEQRASPRSDDELGDRWWRDQMLKLVAALETLDELKSGLVRGVSEAHGWGVKKRLEFASSVEERTLSGAVAQAAWSKALETIAASPKYAGLKLVPQLGLLPIGEDPRSGLCEFADLQSGELAQRGADGRLRVTEDMGLVFVLLPGGTFWMGAQATDQSGQNYDSQARGNESPVHAVTLSPYFLSKYEMTQGQWERFTGQNPSNYGPSTDANGHQRDLTHPVEQVTWAQCVELLSRLGLELPSESQWEYGCRGGRDTPWWTGADRESLRGHVNLADQTAKKCGAPWPQIADWPDLEDGWVVHAPVGSLTANPYGLHEVSGNVWEWCRDGYADYSSGNQVDPVTPWIGASNRVLRGGSFNLRASDARSASRGTASPEHQSSFVGLRPARELRLSVAALPPQAK